MPDIESLSNFCKNLEGAPLDSGRFSTVNEIYKKIDLKDSIAIGRFGGLCDSLSLDLNQISLSEDGSNPITLMANLCNRVVGSMESADPRLLIKKKAWHKRLFGANVAEVFSYHESVLSIDDTLSEVPGAVLKAETSINAITQSRDVFLKDIDSLKDHILAGKYYLQENSSSDKSENFFGNNDSRMRFERRVSQLITTLTSSQISLKQLDLVQNNSLDMLDRILEITNVSVPLWKNRRLAIHVGETLDVDSVASATEAHDQLVTSLSEITEQ